MEVDAVTRKVKGKGKSGKGKKSDKKVTQTKVTGKRQQNTHDSSENVETAESTDTKLLLVGTSRRTNLKEKARTREVEI